jgi:predicted amidohydrolase
MKKNKLKIAIAQLRSSSDPWANLLQAQSFAKEAEAAGCELLCFPENVFYRGPKTSPGFERSQIVINAANPSNDFSIAVMEFIKQTPLALSLGSVFEESADPHKPYNAHWFVHPGGRIRSYKKIHLFNFESNQGSYRESDEVLAGKDSVVEPLGDFNFGLSICFDLRFAELFRDLTLKKGANVLLIPAAFTYETGQAHWHTLLRARAIENQSYVIAAGQWGSHFNAKGEELFCYGHSLVYSPWGELIVEGPEQSDALLPFEIDQDQITRTRARLPALTASKIQAHVAL